MSTKSGEAPREPRELRATSLFVQGGQWHTGYVRFQRIKPNRRYAYRRLGRYAIDRTGGL